MRARFTGAETIRWLRFEITDGPICGVPRINGAPRRIRVDSAQVKYVDGEKVQISVFGPVMDSNDDPIPHTSDARFWSVDPKAFGNDPIDRLPGWLLPVWEGGAELADGATWEHVWPEEGPA